jgi:hypothetical protein
MTDTTSSQFRVPGPWPPSREPPAPLGTDRLLRPALRVDAVVTGLNGAGYLVAAPLLDELLGLPAGLLTGVGVFLLGFAAAVWAVGAGTPISTGAAGTVVVTNLLWVAASATVAASGWSTPTTVGTVWIVLQAVVVAAFAAVQAFGLRTHSRS